jgi:predicted ribosome quality control (RQC) complex YloA/Tae2 family protein
VLLGARDVSCALAERLPSPPDPRGQRFELLERTIRGARVREAVVSESQLELRLEPRGEGSQELTLVFTAGERPSAAHLETAPDGRRIWSLAPAGATARAKARAAGAAGAGPAGAGGGARAIRPGLLIAATDAAQVEALREAIARAFREDFERALTRTLAAAERQLRRREEGARGDLERARERRGDRRRGEILLAHFREVPRGASRVGLPDPYADSPDARIEIDLDPALSPQENAARLFQSAKRGERGESLAEERLASTLRLLEELDRARREVLSAAPKEALQRLGAFLDDAGVAIKSARGDGRDARLGLDRAHAAPRAERPGRRPPGAHKSIGPRTFSTSDGWEVWVGRNNLDNDRITHRLSNPHDFWLHAVGVPGSHVILRRPNRNAVPAQATLVEAAEIAAWFSKGRKLSRVPVLYTERKFVSKPRRAKPGQAVCTRERELLVRPRKPGGTTGTADDD